MPITLLFFGALTESTGLSKTTVNLLGMLTLNDLNTYIMDVYPNLKKQKYTMAINQKIVTANHRLQDGDEVAFLPPFAGG
jgi:molybdopterin synthase sulfur carrier subunit